MRLSVVVSGLFHYGHYVEHLSRQSGTVDFYYAHRRRTTFDLGQGRAENLFFKEYATGLHLKLLSERWLHQALRAYHLLWKWQLARRFVPADVNLFLLHGNGLNAMDRCLAAGKRVVGEAVNMHPTGLRERLSSEAKRIGLPHSTFVDNERQIVEEVSRLDFLLAPSTPVAESFVERGFPEARVKVLPYGVGQPGSTTISVATGSVPARTRSPLVLVVGQVSLRKGHHLLLETVRGLPGALGKDLQLRFVGRVDPDYMRLLRSMGVAFEHETHCPHAELMQVVASASVLVLPSLEDGFGMVVTEALLCRTPVIVSRHAGAADTVRQFGGGYVVDPHDAVEFAAAIENVLDGRTPPRKEIALPDWRDYARSLHAELCAEATR